MRRATQIALRALHANSDWIANGERIFALFCQANAARSRQPNAVDRGFIPRKGGFRQVKIGGTRLVILCGKRRANVRTLPMLKIVALILILTLSSIHALAFSKTTRAQDPPTLAEVIAAKDIAKRFATRLGETSDFALLIEEFCVEDSVQRYVARQKKLIEERTSSSDEFFLFPGIWCDAALFDEATIDDWRRFYVAAYNFFYETMVVVALRMLEDGKSLEGDLDPGELFPQEVINLFRQHPILEDFILGMDQNPRPIKVVDELRDVTANIEKATNMMRIRREKELTAAMEDRKKLLQLLFHQTVSDPFIESDGETWGYPKGTQIVRIQTALMFDLLLIKEGKDYRVLFVELHFDD